MGDSQDDSSAPKPGDGGARGEAEGGSLAPRAIPARRAEPEDAEATSDGAPPSSAFDGEDFLFHLYRGSELLQDNRLQEAREELTTALSMQPRDVEGQGLLGVVYFRLGMYPRAIEIYEELVRARPTEVTPRINLALCYLKTGQSLQARNVLEEVIRLVPDHGRAWGYLGLVFERLGDFAKAQVAFERAKQPHLARRMERLLAARDEPERESVPPDRAEIQRAAQDAAEEVETEAVPGPFSIAHDDSKPAASRSGRWRAIELGQEPLPPAGRPMSPQPSLRSTGSIDEKSEVLSEDAPAPVSERAPLAPGAAGAGPRDLSALTSAARFPFSQVGLRRFGDNAVLARIEVSVGVRAEALRALVPGGSGFKTVTLCRRSRGRELDEPLGGLGSPIVSLEGAGELVLAGRDGRLAHLTRLGEQFLYVREERLLAFLDVSYENGRFAVGEGRVVPMVQLSGAGDVAFESVGPISALEVVVEQPVIARAEHVIGWSGRLLPRPLEADQAPGGVRGLVAFSGDGAVLLDGQL